MLKLTRLDAVVEKKLKRKMDQRRRLDRWRKRLTLFPDAVRAKAALKSASEPTFVASISKQLTACHLTLKAITSNEPLQETQESGVITVSALGHYRAVRCFITHVGTHPPFIWFNQLTIAAQSASSNLNLTIWVRV